MRSSVLFVVLWAGFAQICGAAERQIETCEQVRAKIGVLPLADPDLLRELAARTECGFSSGDIYKAAYGGELPSYRERMEGGRAEEDDAHHHREHSQPEDDHHD